MKTTRIAVLGALVITSSFVLASPSKKDLAKVADKTAAAIKTECGCPVTITYSSKLDFTAKNGGDLALNVQSAIEDFGQHAHEWCKKGDDFPAKFCDNVKSFEVDEDRKTSHPYNALVSPGVIRSYIATKDVLSNLGGAWVQPYLQTGKIPARKSDE